MKQLVVIFLLFLFVFADKPNCHLYTTGQDECTSVPDCCWTSALNNVGESPTFQGHCKICSPLHPEDLEALQKLWKVWEYPVNFIDSQPDEILCPHQGLVKNARVNCDEDGRINDLLLGNDYLYGDIKHLCEIADHMPNMEVLSLSGNELYGELPDCLSKMTKLETLFLNHNFLHGKLPDLSKMSELTTPGQCRLISTDDETHLRADVNCFECGPTWNTLPEACLNDANLGHPNKCLHFNGQEVSACPPPVIPTRAPSPPGGFCETEDGNPCFCGNLECQCDPMTGGCNQPGYECDDEYCVLADPEYAELPSYVIPLAAVGGLLLLLCIGALVYFLLIRDDEEEERKSKRVSRSGSRAAIRGASKRNLQGETYAAAPSPGTQHYAPANSTAQYGPTEAYGTTSGLYAPATMGAAGQMSAQYSPASQGQSNGSFYGAATPGGVSESYGTLEKSESSYMAAGQGGTIDQYQAAAYQDSSAGSLPVGGYSAGSIPGQQYGELSTGNKNYAMY